MKIKKFDSQSFLTEVEVLKDLLSTYLSKHKSAQTQEEKSLVESELLVLFERIIDLDFTLNELKLGQYPEYDSFKEFYDNYLYIMKANLMKLRKLTELFLTSFNHQQVVLFELIGKLKRVKQKKAALSLWNREKAKFVLNEEFLNFDNLDNSLSTSTSCYVDSSQGLLTLPIRDRVSVKVKRVKITSGSNGQPGNSDTAIQTNNIKPESILKSNGEWFEYERLDFGPLKLNLSLELNRPEIINQISIKPLNIGQNYSFRITDILISNDGYETSIRDLVGDIGESGYEIKSVGNDTEWILSFLPIKAKTIIVKFFQNYSYDINTYSNSSNTIARKRFVIGIQNIMLSQIRYEDTGSINSVERSLPQAFYALNSVTKSWPKDQSLFSLESYGSEDGGESWFGIGQDSSLLSGGESFIWKVLLKRNADALKSVSSYSTEDKKVTIDSILRSVSAGKSPVAIGLPTRPVGDAVFGIQPRIAQRGNSTAKLLIGKGAGTNLRIELPFQMIGKDLEPSQLKIYVNRIPYAYVPDTAAVGPGDWSFTDDYKEIILDSSVPDGANIYAVLEEERMFFEQKGDSYFHFMEMLFDPDKDRIQIEYVPADASRVTVILPRDKSVIKLDHKNIDASSFVLTSSNGTSYVSVGDRTSLVTTTNGYFLESAEGLLLLNEAFSNDSVRATYSHRSIEKLSSDKYEIVYQGIKPIGIKVDNGDLVVVEATDTVGTTLASRLDPIKKIFETRGRTIALSSTDATYLSYDQIIKGTVVVSNDLLDTDYKIEEVDFIDGKTEFLGLIPMDSEETATTSSTAGLVTFRLSAGGLWYKGFDVVFSNTTIFSTLAPSLASVNSLGEYYVADDGTVTVYVGTGNSLAGGIKIFYYYQDPSFDRVNKYSVDYRRGALYAGSLLQAGATIKYKAASYICSYDVAKELDSYYYDSSSNSVYVKTEGMKQFNRSVKLFWDKDSGVSGLKDIEAYFSPLIYSFSQRFF
jgi:hypothetical protein